MILVVGSKMLPKSHCMLKAKKLSSIFLDEAFSNSCVAENQMNTKKTNWTSNKYKKIICQFYRVAFAYLAIHKCWLWQRITTYPTKATLKTTEYNYCFTKQRTWKRHHSQLFVRKYYCYNFAFHFTFSIFFVKIFVYSCG